MDFSYSHVNVVINYHRYYKLTGFHLRGWAAERYNGRTGLGAVQEIKEKHVRLVPVKQNIKILKIMID
jgi:hypothetical protein